MGELFSAGVSATIAKGLLLAPAALLPIMNPFAMAPIYLSIVGPLDSVASRRMARRVAVNSTLVLLVSMFIGAQVLRFFGISLEVVRVGGGLLVAATAWNMLTGPAPEPDSGGAGLKPLSTSALAGKSWFPITFPLTVGPGSISVAIALGATMSFRTPAQIVGALALAAGALLSSAVLYLCYRYAARLVDWLGSAGTLVMTRLMAFMLLCIGVQLLWDGVADLVVDLAPRLR